MRTTHSNSHLLGGEGEGSASVHAGIPPGPGPPRCGPGDPPGQTPQPPPGCGPEPPRQTPQPPPWVWAWRPSPGQAPQPPPWVCVWRPSPEKNSWHTLLKILPFPNFVAGGNNNGVVHLSFRKYTTAAHLHFVKRPTKTMPRALIKDSESLRQRR